MAQDNLVNKTRKGLLTLLASGILAGCNLDLKYAIEPIAKADFNGDGIEEVVGYTMDPTFPTSPGTLVLAIINGKNIEKRLVHGQHPTLYVPKDKIHTIQPHARFYDKYNIENVSVEDVNGDGLPDVSYDMTIGAKKHKVMYNQGNNNEGNAILKGEM